MPNKSISMNKIRQVLRCYASGSGTKKVSAAYAECLPQHCQKYLHIYQKSGLSLEDILSLDDTSLCSLFSGNRKNNQKKCLRATRSFMPFSPIIPNV